MRLRATVVSQAIGSRGGSTAQVVSARSTASANPSSASWRSPHHRASAPTSRARCCRTRSSSRRTARDSPVFAEVLMGQSPIAEARTSTLP